MRKDICHDVVQVLRCESEVLTQFLLLTEGVEIMEKLFFKRAKRTFEIQYVSIFIMLSTVFFCA